MPVNNITYQPNIDQLMATYRPIVFRVQASTDDGPTPPYVVCDVYIENVYYKSIIRSAPESFDNIESEWSFDISDVLAEYLEPDLAAITNNNLLQAPHMSAQVYVRFRASSLDDDGFTVEEPLKPVQGTRFEDPVAGTGLVSNNFWVINSALQHEDNMNLESHLGFFKQGLWDENAFPLTHRDKYHFCPGDSDHFPFIYRGDCIEVDIVLNYRLRGETGFTTVVAEDINVCNPIFISSIDITGNQVTVNLTSPIPVGQQVQVQIKKQTDSIWVDAGSFATQSFSFNVQGSDIAGGYDIRIILFCTNCLSADPVVDTFTLDGTTTTLAWRGITPFCVIEELESTIYAVVERRNVVSEQAFFPNQSTPITRTDSEVFDLWVKFYSDSTHLTPMNVTQTNLKVHVKNVRTITETQGVNTYNRVQEIVTTYTVSPAGVNEIVLATDVEQIGQVFNYSPPGGPQTSQVQTLHSYAVFPSDLLEGGPTGFRGYTTLEEYNTDTNTPTGTTKPNDSGDPDYITPVADLVTCPPLPLATVSYASNLFITQVEFLWAGPNVEYADAIGTTYAGGYFYELDLPLNTDIQLTVHARTLDPGNVTGFVKVRVEWVDINGATQNSVFNAINNVGTVMPAALRNIVSVSISNF